MASPGLIVQSATFEKLSKIKAVIHAKSYAEVIRHLIERYLAASPGAPREMFEVKKKRYWEEFPQGFLDATTTCLGVMVPKAFDAIFEESITAMIDGPKPVMEDDEIIRRCPGCKQVWSYSSPDGFLRKYVHCPKYQRSMSVDKWKLRVHGRHSAPI